MCLLSRPFKLSVIGPFLIPMMHELACRMRPVREPGTDHTMLIDWYGGGEGYLEWVVVPETKQPPPPRRRKAKNKHGASSSSSAPVVDGIQLD